MPNHSDIYKTEALKYDLMISKQPDVLASIQSICPLEGADVIDLGAGTGRLTVPIARVAKSVLALDASADMLAIAAGKLTAACAANWRVGVSDNRCIAAADHSADVLVSGWSISYVANTEEAEWERNLGLVMSEIRRVLRPGGTAIIMETLGTGAETPAPPDFLVGYYAQLENNYGFHHTWIRTDYRFDHQQQAEELTEFFFGRHVSELVAHRKLTTLPECAGIWWHTF